MREEEIFDNPGAVLVGRHMHINYFLDLLNSNGLETKKLFLTARLMQVTLNLEILRSADAGADALTDGNKKLVLL